MYQSRHSFEGKSVIVTGAGAGMGKQIAEDFLSQGSTVIAIDYNEDNLGKTKKDLEAKGLLSDKYIPFVGDISREETIDKAIEKAIETSGSIDILINNAGVASHSEPIGDTTNEEWERILGINLTGAMYALRAAVNKMITQENGGIIITTASMAGIKNCKSSAAYTASKHALIGLVKNTAYMYLHKNIRCNLVCPGAIKTEMINHFQEEHPFGVERILSGIDKDMIYGTPQDIANAVLFLASDEARFINGTALEVDGGMGCD